MKMNMYMGLIAIAIATVSGGSDFKFSDDVLSKPGLSPSVPSFTVGMGCFALKFQQRIKISTIWGPFSLKPFLPETKKV